MTNPETSKPVALTVELSLAALRHGMTALGVFAVAGGFAEDMAAWQVFTAEFLGVVGFLWSVARKALRQSRTGDPS